MIDYAAFARLGVATVYEGSGKAGLVNVDLHQIVPASRVAGPARTVHCGQDDNLMVHAAIERIQPGEVVVVTMPEPRPFALIGDLLATQIRKRGAAGILIDASIRDYDELVAMGLPIWARWIRVQGAEKKIVGALDVPVTIGGAMIAPGDIVVLDADGACVVDQRRAAEVLAAAQARFEREESVRERYERGELSYDLNNLRPLVEAAKA